ncbi:haloacid dehalogenase superfamily, subfamily IA, variant 3 with third motif having DD or ED/haloacid dehalogenase superfamily, subfamily IA, variant 1 with third motif having Dx(3-4)D or Dx(3-4)E [Pseudomonas sp. NFIX51]|uniref:HAD family hydrolase n=1 Tax=unclassified Pseudomonas TaxID=196821 RepID=UPI0008B837BD|nr:MULTISPECIES: HAD family hydrolase [unclassified Pseudomonas]SEM61787.1 haloacid dehalogenase superfamily, subfamily IA, variant 3 with third motif having DD or ED/haloacid dehalogenase superfamily, subfamily IA, variant 1 with third motif having Dx(3-4)D or Dx(3-4)E [Pseudomonas sp. NFACC41-3]SMH62260.1 haloacid dehalogenase superfamily, subfamily IA, variant 3 with third motif having DD or ED/haloacid dehalogenase superfamily, subfamily IA, variant 1 with third motif having Dx(3-4)D or Dx(3-
MSLAEVRHWVFDMDGTLTVAVHDFAAIREALGIPPEHDILTHLAALPAAEAAAKHAWLLEHERDLALGSRPAPGAVELVRELAARGYRLGILTRNARELAHITLEAIGLADCFAVEDVLGRDEAPPKPHPGGLLKLAAAWAVAPAEMVMVGDYRFDLDCGRAAGTHTVLVNLPDNPWPELADWHAEDCVILKQMLLA